MSHPMLIIIVDGKDEVKGFFRSLSVRIGEH